MQDGEEVLCALTARSAGVTGFQPSSESLVRKPVVPIGWASCSTFTDGSKDNVVFSVLYLPSVLLKLTEGI